ncbi:MAG TPA: hypothetical protein PK629_05635 [Oscillospiraceae bacterium]|nr:hypothetical protein [Oscillospiraceae bacterium]HPF55979.1 hypothetical protein [Clostridiales bacterium]HPK34437.1 hypothetical protein [Oscillospiraceae bacterium]HPR75578.1 hypothetical protein [Oscillospiraceae bacterium]
MSRAKRVISILLLFVLSLSMFTACGPDTEAIVTIKGQAFSVEQYLMFQLDAYNTMASKMSYTFNQQKDDGSYLTVKEQMELYNNIDGNRVDVWISATTLEELRKVVYYDQALADAGITITDEEITNANDQAKAIYDYYEAYYDGYYTRNGINLEAVQLWLLNSLKENKLFKSIYDTDGTLAVPEADIQSHFQELYASAKIMKIPYFNESSGVVLTDDQIDNIDAFCQTAIERLNSGAIDIDSLYYNFLLANSVISEGDVVDPIPFQLFDLNDNDYTTDMISSYEALEIGQTGYTKDTNQGYFFIYLKGDPLTDDASNYTNYRDTVLRDLKDSEFQENIMAITDSYEIVMNTRLMKKYLPENIEKLS